MKRVAIYLRVSTSKQETGNQRRELEAVAARSGWQIVKVYEDAGISGAKGRDGRPGLDAMMKAVNAKEFDMVASWSVDRLGRSLTDLLSILQGLHEKGVDLFLHQQASTLRRPRQFKMLIAGFLFRGGETEIDGDDRTVQDFISRSFHFDMKNNSRPSEPRSSLNERYAELLELREEVRRFTSSRLNPRRRHQA